MTICPAKAEFFHGRVDGQTDMKKLIIALRNCFCERVYENTFKLVLAVVKQKGDCSQYIVLPFQAHDNSSLKSDTTRDYKHAVVLSVSIHSSAVSRFTDSQSGEITKHGGLKNEGPDLKSEGT